VPIALVLGHGCGLFADRKSKIDRIVEPECGALRPGVLKVLLPQGSSALVDGSLDGPA
jgi:hypothetical protein